MEIDFEILEASIRKEVHMIRLQTHLFEDRQAFSQNIFSLLTPVGWTVSGGIKWRSHTMMPAAIYFSASSADGQYTLNMLPLETYYWEKASISVIAKLRGSPYPQHKVCRPPESALEYLRQFVMPALGGEKIEDVRRFAELEQGLLRKYTAGPGALLEVSADIAGISYAGGSTRGKLACGIVQNKMKNGRILWMADHILATRMPKEDPQQLDWVFPVILNSFRIEQDWYIRYYEYMRESAQNSAWSDYQPPSIVHLNSYDEIPDAVRNSYEIHQKSSAQVYRAFTGKRDTYDYYDPYKGHVVELPSGYNYAYANPLGEYVVTDDAAYHPNAVVRLQWKKLRKTTDL